MKITVITLFPEMIKAVTGFGLLGQAIEKGIIEIQIVNPRNFCGDVHKTVDDRPFGGGDGMIMMAEPLKKAMQTLPTPSHKIYLSPQGQKLDNEKVRSLSEKQNIILVCGRYGGVDQRFINECIDEEISIGDYVLSGGEMAAGVVIEAISRFVPGVLGHADSAKFDSFSNGLLEAPHFTKPRDWDGKSVPEILVSGNHKKIEQWKSQVSQLVTLQKRPDLFWCQNEIMIDNLKNFYNELSESEKLSIGLKLDSSAFVRPK